MVTKLEMCRSHLITKERMEKYCSGQEFWKASVNDDLESFLDDIQQGGTNRDNWKYTDIYSYFLPKLPEEELRLVERKNQDYFESFRVLWQNRTRFLDVSEAEMNLSESKSKFVKGYCRRRTFIVRDFYCPR